MASGIKMMKTLCSRFLGFFRKQRQRERKRAAKVEGHTIHGSTAPPSRPDQLGEAMGDCPWAGQAGYEIGRPARRAERSIAAGQRAVHVEQFGRLAHWTALIPAAHPVGSILECVVHTVFLVEVVRVAVLILTLVLTQIMAF